MVGLTGSGSMIDTVVKQYRVRYRVDAAGDPMRYTMDHTASLCSDRTRRPFLTKIAHGIAPQALADRLRNFR